MVWLECIIIGYVARLVPLDVLKAVLARVEFFEAWLSSPQDAAHGMTMRVNKAGAENHAESVRAERCQDGKPSRRKRKWKSRQRKGERQTARMQLLAQRRGSTAPLLLPPDRPFLDAPPAGARQSFSQPVPTPVRPESADLRTSSPSANDSRRAAATLVEDTPSSTPENTPAPPAQVTRRGQRSHDAGHLRAQMRSQQSSTRRSKTCGGPPPSPVAQSRPGTRRSDLVSKLGYSPEAFAPYTSGKTALFIGNRPDHQLGQALMKFFAFRRLDTSLNSVRQLRIRAIESGTYDFVLGATGFCSHEVDRRVVPACRKGGARYVRVNHGRLAACCRAMARTLGIGTTTSTASAGRPPVSRAS